ncbi:MAG: G/U mismatch-specific DNA glycosylase [Burkholderiales bacterium]
MEDRNEKNRLPANRFGLYRPLLRLVLSERPPWTASTAPSRAELLAAAGKTVPDLIAHKLRVLFCGINPGLYSGAVGHHFARPGNRFWRVLHLAEFTDRVLAPHEETKLLDFGLGITNLVARTTAKASELSLDELLSGARVLEKKVRRYSPRCVAVLGIGVYRKAFERPWARLGRQEETVGEAEVWLLPNPSGLNAHYPRVDDLRNIFQLLERASR